MNIHMLKHLPEFVLLHGPLFHYSCFGFESMNNHLKNMIHGTRFVNDQISFAVGMSKCLPDLVKSEMKNCGLEVKSLLQLLSTNLESEYTENREHVLGALRNYTLTRKERNLFGEDPGHVLKAHRVASKIGTIDCEEYKRSHNKNSHIIHYYPEKYGSVKYFLKTENGLVAVVNRFEVEQTILLAFSSIDDAALKQNELKILPQYKQVAENSRS
ncbi:uncharacterized protein LOC117315956 [Pecten maximus]|uniref:uncharacterized protein LOC117315956 n=1 Tax=Pecten maximus TaxID=6579 RepID=UPI0014583871|nr:uncharacterized protein LOC117315956 [Pecten maximus]